MEDEEPTGYIRFEKFLPVMIKVLSERRYRCETEDILLRAFQVMDTDNKGYLTQEELTKFMTEEGEILSPDEMEEMLGAAVDPEKGYINYKEYVTKLVIHDTKWNYSDWEPLTFSFRNLLVSTYAVTCTT